MNCQEKRTFLNVFMISTCEKCSNYVTDEQIIIGNKTIGIYHIFSGCKLLKETSNEQMAFSSKLRLLMKDAVIYQEKIFLFYCEDFKINYFLEIFSKILDEGFFVQIITL